jgi:lipopolysaccharide transport system permease protein
METVGVSRGGRWKALVSDVKEMVAEQVQYRDLLLRMTERDMRIRYKQSIMGFGWAIFMPVVNMIVFSVIFMRVAPIKEEALGMPYPIFAFSGLLAWNSFASALRFATTSLTSNPNLVTKVYFPREIFPFSAVLVSLVDFAIGASVLVLMMLWYQVDVTATLLFLPVIVVVQTVFTAAVALVLSMANLYYRDVKYLFEVAIQVWMFTTAVVYPVELVGGWLGQLLLLNPMTPIIDAYRAVIVRGELPAAAPFAMAAVFSVVCLIVAWIAFHRSEFEFAENV